MSEPKKPFYVSFMHDKIPQRVDHSRTEPGLVGGAANRAGHTRIHLKPRLTIKWDHAPTGADGRVPIFVESINVYFRLQDFAISISSDFSVDSCAYRVTRQHELEAHIYDPIRIFHSFRDVLVRRLNHIAIPTRVAPLRATPAQVESMQDEWAKRQLVPIIDQTRRELRLRLQRASTRHDSPASYRLVHNQCTAAQWASGM